jgi:hypothetical protein
VDIGTIVATALRAQLMADVSVTDLLTDEDGQVKIFRGSAEGQADLPLIYMKHVYGGQRYRTPRPEFDVLWVIMGVADSQPEAEQLAGLIFSNLEGVEPSFSEDWIADQKVTFSGEMSEQKISQGETIWSSGGYYRLRASKRIFN